MQKKESSAKEECSAKRNAEEEEEWREANNSQLKVSMRKDIDFEFFFKIKNCYGLYMHFFILELIYDDFYLFCRF